MTKRSLTTRPAKNSRTPHATDGFDREGSTDTLKREGEAPAELFPGIARTANERAGRLVLSTAP